MHSDILTQAHLKELLNYNPLTGIFIWKVTRGCRKAGQQAGTLNHDYIQIRVDGRIYGAHRLAFLYMVGIFPTQLDHDNQIKNDNSWDNLYVTTYLDNNHNHKRTKRNTSNMVGVSWDKVNQKWLVQICVNRKNINLGRYTDFNEAVKVRQDANLKYGFHPNHGK